ncbi:uncharacterized protein I206_106855 [Kwoniella pini CBS 10737]|uniref:Uncharacterized protein n=1 Tax=Kwoniella pini CBS 10737 TaxID=1296096 RepID=A0A1B9I008_9TREE|nr:uncharacterized protein I206_05599 [Kwoniella pini CBS 10737]OCF48818.1 hypothetical protein I206_05599 [Kwoniella pini CBS 10737]
MDNTNNSPTSSSSSSSFTQPSLQPLRNPKYRHISKSAAKRESVQMLGSIKDLQMHFASGGKVEHRPGAGIGIKGKSSLGILGEDLEGEENRPPSSLSDRRRPHPHKNIDLPRIDIEDARREAKSIIDDVRGIWGLSLPLSPSSAVNSNSSGLPSSKSLYFPINFDGDDEAHGENRTSEDIQSALVKTAQSIRRIRFLALSISHNSSNPTSSRSGILQSRLGGAGKIRSSLSTPSRPTGVPLRTVSNPNSAIMTERKTRGFKGDLLSELRKAALEVLTQLRELEESLRVSDRSKSPTEDRPFSPGTDEISGSGSGNGSGSGIFIEPDNYDSEEDELYNPNNLATNSEDTSHLTNWEDRILSEQREYKDLDDNSWEKEARGTREGMGKWVGVVEQLFVFTHEDGKKELEDWAKDSWEGSQLEQLHSFLLSNLPLDLTLPLPSTTSDNFDFTLLSRLSDGYILIHAYNSSLLKSTKPWGFIPDEDVHDTLSSSISISSDHTTPTKGGSREEGKQEKEWTFRKVGNLTCFAAALKHRYQLPIQLPITNLPVPSIPSKLTSARPRPSIDTSLSVSTGSIATTSVTKIEDKIEFDPMIIAKQSPGWETMLKLLIGKWMSAVIRELREVYDAPIMYMTRSTVDRGGLI